MLEKKLQAKATKALKKEAAAAKKAAVKARIAAKKAAIEAKKAAKKAAAKEDERPNSSRKPLSWSRTPPDPAAQQYTESIAVRRPAGVDPAGRRVVPGRARPFLTAPSSSLERWQGGSAPAPRVFPVSGRRRMMGA